MPRSERSSADHSSDWLSYTSSASSQEPVSDGSTSGIEILSPPTNTSWVTSSRLFRRPGIFARRKLRSQGDRAESTTIRHKDGNHSNAKEETLDVAAQALPLREFAPGVPGRPASLRSQLPTLAAADQSQSHTLARQNDRHRDHARLASFLRHPRAGFRHGDSPRTAPAQAPAAVTRTAVSAPAPAPAHAHAWAGAGMMDPTHAAQSPNLADLLTGLSSDEDGSRKMAAFKLQSLINDPSFAEQFVIAGGLSRLRNLIMENSGNTLAYGLASFARLLEVDQGWEAVNDKMIERVVELVVCQPLVNILRGAMAILVSVVSRPYHADRSSRTKAVHSTGGFQALKPAVAVYPQFLEMLVSRLSSADHALCANALQLINSLMRDAITNDNETEWPKFIKRTQDLGVIKAVYVLMQSSALQDLAHPLLEFQALTKILLKRWREVPVDLVKPEHRRTIKAIHLSSNPERQAEGGEPGHGEPKHKHNPFKWRRLGFTSENPEPDFADMGFLGFMDLSNYVRVHQDDFQNILLEQSVLPEAKRCPLAQASLIVTGILFEHYEVDKMDLEDSKSYLALESRTNFDKVFKPLLLLWPRLHVAGLHAFFRLWQATGAEKDDLAKIVELVRILVESVVGGADRTQPIEEIEMDLAAFECGKLRELQMELLELTYEDVWGPHLRGVREELQTEALQFVKEQRIRCLLAGSWFAHGDVSDPVGAGAGGLTPNATAVTTSVASSHRFIRLSDNRKYLHWGDFEEKTDQLPAVASLHDRIDLSIVSSVVSSVTANDRSSIGSDMTLKGLAQDKFTTTRITIHGYVPWSRGGGRPDHARSQSKASTGRSTGTGKEQVLLTFQPASAAAASEWLDGLLMLLDQQPITPETKRLMGMMSDYGVKVRLLNVRFNDEEGIVEGMDGIDGPVIPTREGLDEDYFYDI